MSNVLCPELPIHNDEPTEGGPGEYPPPRAAVPPAAQPLRNVPKETTGDGSELPTDLGVALACVSPPVPAC